jgi:hypothetical protein
MCNFYSDRASMGCVVAYDRLTYCRGRVTTMNTVNTLLGIG